MRVSNLCAAQAAWRSVGPRAAAAGRVRPGLLRQPSGARSFRGPPPARAGDITEMLNRLLGNTPARPSNDLKAGVPRTSVVFSDTAPSWSELEALHAQRAAELGWTDPWTGTADLHGDFSLGPTNPKAMERLFGQPRESVRIKLYRDHAAWCPYCQKVWLMLEEKQVPYVLEKINMRCYGDKPAEFMAKVPGGLLPVIELDGQVITESDLIMDVIEREYPNPPTLPTDGDLAPYATRLMRLERQMFSLWLNWLCSNGNPAPQRRRFLEGLDIVEEALQRANDGEILPGGWAEADNLAPNTWGSPGPFFLGGAISQVDFKFAPFLERMVSSLLYYKGFQMRSTGRYPALEKWFEAMEQRSTYMGTRSDHYAHCHDLPPQLGGCGMSEEGMPYATVIDGRLPSESWRLPLEPLGADSLEAYSPGEGPEGHDALEAAARMLANREAVVKFACRGVGQKGPKPVSAPLSDPTAIPNMEVAEDVDAMLRHVTHALIVGVSAKQDGPAALKAEPEPRGDKSECEGWSMGPCLAYVRDHVCVPRDIRFPAARQLRAHLNWASDIVAQANMLARA